MNKLFLSKFSDSVTKLRKKQASQPSYDLLGKRVVRGLTLVAHIGLMLLLLTGIVPIFRVEPDAILQATRNWFSISFVVLTIYLVLKFLELSIRNSELEEDRENSRHIRELQWQEIKTSQKRDAIERGFRIADSCNKLLSSLEFDKASKEEARLLLLQIFQDEEAVDSFIKYSKLNKFSDNSLGQAKDEGIVLSVGEDAITVQDIRKIEAAFDNRFGLFLSTLKEWSHIHKGGIKELDKQKKDVARSDLTNILELKFKGTSKLSENFKESFDKIFMVKL